VSTHAKTAIAASGWPGPAAIAAGPKPLIPCPRDTRRFARRLLSASADAGLGTATLTSADEVAANEITVFKDRAIDLEDVRALEA
jgi:hypothetical protein